MGPKVYICMRVLLSIAKLKYVCLSISENFPGTWQCCTDQHLKWDQEQLHNLQEPVQNEKAESEVAQSCLHLCDPMDCSLSDSSVHRIFQARLLEWIAISFSRGSSWPRDRTQVFCIVGRHFYRLSHQGSQSPVKKELRTLKQRQWHIQLNV